jgi:hypothetical protein
MVFLTKPSQPPPPPPKQKSEFVIQNVMVLKCMYNPTVRYNLQNVWNRAESNPRTLVCHILLYSRYLFAPLHL